MFLRNFVVTALCLLPGCLAVGMYWSLSSSPKLIGSPQGLYAAIAGALCLAAIFQAIFRKALPAGAPPLIGSLGLVLYFLVYNMFGRDAARGQGRYTACLSNLRNLGQTLDLYAADSQGQYPPTLAHLVQSGRLKKIPVCFGSSEERRDGVPESYSPGYEHSAKGYTLFCSGRSHADIGIAPDHPVVTKP